MRDAKGHFAKSSPTAKFLNGLVSSSSNVSNDQTLVDIHVNNPLHKIVELLQDIKTQKAFSFTLKGSVGLAGIAVAFAVVGIFVGQWGQVPFIPDFDIFCKSIEF